MKVNQIKSKVAKGKAKVAKGKAKVAAKCGKVAKCLLILFALASIATGCATAENRTPTKAQNSTQENNTYNIYSYVGGHGTSNSIPADVWARIPNSALADVIAAMFRPAVNVEIGNQAQANDTSGTETLTNAPTQTPTADVKPQTTLTYGLCSGTAGETDWIQDLTAASAKDLSSWLRSGNANGEFTVTKRDGSTETVTCKDGTCTTSSGECITCGDPGACSECTVK